MWIEKRRQQHRAHGASRSMVRTRKPSAPRRRPRTSLARATSSAVTRSWRAIGRGPIGEAATVMATPATLEATPPRSLSWLRA
jgi:hypothetical protein